MVLLEGALDRVLVIIYISDLGDWLENALAWDYLL